MAEENKALTAVLQGNASMLSFKLAAQGSASQTKEAFTKVLNVPDVKLAADGYKDIMMRLNSIKDVTLLMANKVFLMEKYILQEEFKSITTQQFLAEVQLLDFAKGEAAAKTINTWVEQKTNNKIKDLIDGKLPYVNNSISLIVILPNKRNGWGIDDLEEKLAETDLTKITENMYKPEVEVSLPKFKIEQTIDLKQSLTELGLADIFSHNANFSKMIGGSEDLYVSKVVQKAFIEVNEEGAEAAAATGAVVRTLRCANFPKVFLANHPFIVLLFVKEHAPENNEMHHILFYGKITTPYPSFIGHNRDELDISGMIMAMRMVLIPQDPEQFKADHPYTIYLVHRKGNLIQQLFTGRVAKPQV
ncbi:hypothetical protein NQ317_015062 [Molorchus minor]|uniref:Serpin domain-containing protein n=1 Tax=Molorchus minor TaxID=1323400 RepID=A0ABQ9K686_9CUCU|nr:hypothetical protein NQ317_015062 [Molorchus minor]